MQKRVTPPGPFFAKEGTTAEWACRGIRKESVQGNPPFPKGRVRGSAGELKDERLHGTGIYPKITLEGIASTAGTGKDDMNIFPAAKDKHAA